METYERRTQIWEKLRIPRKDTIANLAKEFEVSKQTIRRDIDALSREHYIFTLPGRYTGGVFVGDNVGKSTCFSETEVEALLKILDYINQDTQDIFTENEKKFFEKFIYSHFNPSSINTQKHI